jgi:hypothetical protein
MKENKVKAIKIGIGTDFTIANSTFKCQEETITEEEDGFYERIFVYRAYTDDVFDKMKSIKKFFEHQVNEEGYFIHIDICQNGKDIISIRPEMYGNFKDTDGKLIDHNTPFAEFFIFELLNEGSNEGLIEFNLKFEFED